VRGLFSRNHQEGEVDKKLDGKAAYTMWKVLGAEKDRNESLVLLKPRTGRFHQLRRHLEMLGHPIMGDPLYGRENKNHEGLQLICYQLWMREFKKGAYYLPRKFIRQLVIEEECLQKI
jgi:tRNA pseudouridine32 synthase/23S rRNA pseudouridine746 synthase